MCFGLWKGGRGVKESSALAPGGSWSWSPTPSESLNRAPMNITTSLDLKSPGIFVGIACALQESNSPLSAALLLHWLHRSVRVPARTRARARTHCQVTSCYRVSSAIPSAQGYCCDHICSCGLNLVERLLQRAHITIETKCFLFFFFFF